jgi:hypothetical protein
MGLAARTTIQKGQRTFNRLRLGVPASLILTHERSGCTLENISSTGACLRVPRPIAKGGTAILCFHLLKLYGVVMWSRDHLCGLRFETPLEREDMQGFLWIVQNREEYDRICREELLEDAGTGFGTSR